MIKVLTSFKSSSSFDRFQRIITTPKGSRVHRPHFGSLLYTLVDGNFDATWRMNFTSYVMECFFDENYVPWDDEFVPKKVNIIKVDTTKGIVVASVEFEDSSFEFEFGN